MTLSLLTSCMISEQDLNSGTYKGEEELHMKTQNDVVREFSINTSIGKLSLSGFWDILDDGFYIETFSSDKSITIIGKFDTDTSAYGEWYVENDKGEWEAIKVKDTIATLTE